MIGILKALLGMGGEQVEPLEAARRIRRGAVLIDVREPGEFAAGHATAAIPLPLGHIRAQGARALDACTVPEHAEILLVCRSGLRSRIAQSLLAKEGRHHYVNVSGGMLAWAASGLPVIRDAGMTDGSHVRQ